MLSPLKETLRNYQLVLASTSAQRKAIWEQIGLKFTAVASTFDEELVSADDFVAPSDFVRHLARSKALAVCAALDEVDQDTVVVGADTVIVDGNKIIGKPHTKESAIETLQSLSGRKHKVCTGVAIVLMKNGGTNSIEDTKETVFVSTTEVEFASLSREIIKSYVDSGEPLDKAGSYAIQGLGCLLVKGIQGDYYNVVGFPIHDFCVRVEQLLKEDSTH